MLPGGRDWCLLLVLGLLCLSGLIGYPAAAEQDIVRVTKERRITANVVDLPLGKVLTALSEKLPLEIRGNVDGNERLTLHFSQRTLKEALNEMMRGYNYVLIYSEEQEKSILVILGKVERRAAPVPASTPTDLPSSPPRVPPAQPASVQPPPSVPAPAPQGTAAPPAPAPASPSAASAPEGQAAATTQANSAAPNTPGEPGVAQNPNSESDFNPAAWGGRGFRGGRR